MKVQEDVIKADLREKEYRPNINSLSAELYPIYHLLALLGAHPIFHFSMISVNEFV
jgi:hypothetical protein